MYAAMKGYPPYHDTVALIKLGADVNAQDPYRFTALTWAVNGGMDGRWEDKGHPCLLTNG